MKKQEHPWQINAGFSLVEIVLAVGIVSFAFVGVIGLLPAGMEVFRSSMNSNIGAQIAQRVLNEAQQTDFSVLIGGVSPGPCSEFIAVRYYDEEGNELTPQEKAKSLYHVRAVVQTAPLFPDNRGKNTLVMNDLATVVVQVAVNPSQHPLVGDAASLLWKKAANIRMQDYSVFVANHD